MIKMAIPFWPSNGLRTKSEHKQTRDRATLSGWLGSLEFTAKALESRCCRSSIPHGMRDILMS